MLIVHLSKVTLKQWKLLPGNNGPFLEGLVTQILGSFLAWFHGKLFKFTVFWFCLQCKEFCAHIYIYSNCPDMPDNSFFFLQFVWFCIFMLFLLSIWWKETEVRSQSWSLDLNGVKLKISLAPFVKFILFFVFCFFFSQQKSIGRQYKHKILLKIQN